MNSSRARRADLLRHQALMVLATRRTAAPANTTLWELQIHQIELEMQNEALRTTQADLEQAKLRYFDLYHAAPVGYCLITRKDIILEANTKAGDLLGAAPTGMAGQSMTSFVHRDDQDRYYLNQKALFETGEPQVLELRMRNQGRVFWAELTTTLTRDRSDVPVGRVVLQDISRRREAEADLSAEKELLDITLRSIDAGVITTDAPGAIRLMNPTAETLCGWTQAQALGQPLGEVFSLVDAAPGRRLLVSQTGQRRNVEVSAAPIGNPGKPEHGQVLVFRDVTEQRNLQDLADQKGKIEALGVQAGVIAHDFSNILGGILGYVSMAKESLPDPIATLEYLDKAGAVFERAKTLTQQLVSFSRGGTPQRKTGPLAPLIRGAATFVLTGSNIQVEDTISENLSLCAFDGTQMSQVFSNLILNAMQAMPMGGTLRLSARNAVLREGEVDDLPGGEYVSLSFADQGQGIPEPLLRTIFDPFFTTRKNSQGLGLSTCRSIIGQHGGAIEVRSKPNQGTHVRVFLPASHRGSPDSETCPLFPGPVHGPASTWTMNPSCE